MGGRFYRLGIIPSFDFGEGEAARGSAAAFGFGMGIIFILGGALHDFFRRCRCQLRGNPILLRDNEFGIYSLRIGARRGGYKAAAFDIACRRRRGNAGRMVFLSRRQDFHIGRARYGAALHRPVFLEEPDGGVSDFILAGCFVARWKGLAAHRRDDRRVGLVLEQRALARRGDYYIRPGCSPRILHNLLNRHRKKF